jgi:protein tyrosine phosphatase (PTP) superfamily phosphohydrolase (DUF442 family)
MEIVRRINDELAIAAPLTPQQFQQIAAEGFKSILNLRSLDKFELHHEQQHVECLGLCYVNLAIDSDIISTEIVVRVLRQMDELPKPILVYCNNAMLAAAMVLMHIAMRQGETLSQAIQRAEKFELFRVSRSSLA